MPRVSVIIPSYNHGKYVAEAIQSVLDQTFQDFEIVITDDGSTDNTVEEIKKFKDQRIRLFEFKENRGASVAANNCVSEAKGEFIAMLSSDDIFLPEKLGKQVKFLDEHIDIVAVFGYPQIIDEDGCDFMDATHPIYAFFRQPNRTRFEWLNYFFYECNSLCHPTVLIRRGCYDEVGFYNPQLAQTPDFDLWIRVCLKHEIHIIQENLIKLRLRAGEANVSGNRPVAVRRTQYEYAKVLKNFLEIKSRKEFLKIFPDASKFWDRIETDFISFYVAMLAMENMRFFPVHQIFAIDVLHDLLGSEIMAAQLEKKYNFRDKNFIELTGKYDFFNLNKVWKLAEIENQLAEKDRQLAEQCAEQNRQLAEKEKQLAEKDTQLAEKEKQLAEKDTQLAEKEKQMIELDCQLLEKDRQLASHAGSEAGLSRVGRPVMIYNMGKVGSTTVYETLRSIMGVPVFTAHLLNDFDETEKILRRDVSVGLEAALWVVNDGRRYRGYIDDFPKEDWNVISLVRDPLAMEVSRFFQALGEDIPARKRIEDGTMDVSELIDIFINKWPHPPPLDWFEDRLKPVFDIDVYSRPFPYEKGYDIIDKGRFSLLLIRLEDLDRCAGQAFEEFLGIHGVELKKGNVATSKWYDKIYKEFKEKIVFTDAFIENMYYSRGARHFYTQAELDAFIARWTRRAGA
ncbi:MAG: glycosyltransferase [Deltaproteobacteria bacterium]|nr:glycosyltransferase [Deltaproteobacteria bacterium]